MEALRADDQDGLSSGYRRDIDGLRAVAITAVVLFHAGIWPFRSGYVGVDIFFVISGYLIGGIIYRASARGSLNLLDFYSRRARRILPMLILIVFVSLMAGLALLTPAELKQLAESAASAMAAVSNFFFWQTISYFSQDAHLDPMLMTWTLGVEEQFYLTLPVILLLARRLRPRIQLLVLAGLTLGSLVLSVTMSPGAPTSSFYLLPTRFWELGAGVLLAVWQSQGGRKPARITSNALSVAGLVAIGLAVVAFDGTTTFPGAAALLPVLGTTALIAAEGSWLTGRVLASPPLVAIGLVSYSWYLWHWPLMAFARLCSVRTPSVLVLSGAGLIALLLAAASWRFIERPFRRAALSGGRTILAYALASVTLIIAMVGLRLADGLPQRLSPGVAEIEAAVSATHNTPCISYGVVPKLSPQCIAPAPRERVIAIIGDSHAGALAPGLQELARQNGWGVDVFAKPSCRPLLGTTVWRRDQPDLAANCARFMNAVVAHVANDPAVITVMLAGLWRTPLTNPPDEEHYADVGHPDSRESGAVLLAMGLLNAVTPLMDAGKRVFLVEDTPYWPFDPARRAKIQAIPLKAAIERFIEDGRIPDTVAAGNAHNDAAAAIVMDVAAVTGARLLDMPAAICPGGSCRYKEGKVILFADASHLTKQGGIRALTPWSDVLFGRNSAH